jgi:hypothetical protein
VYLCPHLVQNLWVCCGCGVLRCGRGVRGHAQKHFVSERAAGRGHEHPIALDVSDGKAWCFLCAAWVICDGRDALVEEIRAHVAAARTAAEGGPSAVASSAVAAAATTTGAASSRQREVATVEVRSMAAMRRTMEDMTDGLRCRAT